MTWPAPFELRGPEGPELPLVVSVPHTGTLVPDELWPRLTASGQARRDTDWHLDRLYQSVPRLGGTLLLARVHRYVIDLNRPLDGAPLYPGRRETELFPTTSFADEPLWRQAPTDAERVERVERVWRPYRERLEALLAAAVARHGAVLLWEAHSIRSVVPRFSPEPLPALMLGDVDGSSAAAEVSQAVAQALAEPGRARWLQRNDPFKGGAITRAYGRPQDGVHALQLEMCQHLYMDEESLVWDEGRAAALWPRLERALVAGARAVTEGLRSNPA